MNIESEEVTSKAFECPVFNDLEICDTCGTDNLAELSTNQLATHHTTKDTNHYGGGADEQLSNF
jgi:hypothetical protein